MEYLAISGSGNCKCKHTDSNYIRHIEFRFWKYVHSTQKDSEHITFGMVKIGKLLRRHTFISIHLGLATVDARFLIPTVG